MENTSEMKKLKSILLIDDDEIYNQIFKLSVNAVDAEIKLHIETGTDKSITYLKELEEHSKPFPDLIFVDVNMPLKDGFEFARLYQQNFLSKNYDTLIYVATSSIITEDRNKAGEYSVINGFKVKGDVMAILKEIMKENFES